MKANGKGKRRIMRGSQGEDRLSKTMRKGKENLTFYGREKKKTSISSFWIDEGKCQSETERDLRARSVSQVL